MTKEQFIERWRRHTVGVIALGSAAMHKVITRPLEGGAATFGTVVCNLDDEATKLLSQLYDSLQPKPDPRPAANGPAPTQGARK